MRVRGAVGVVQMERPVDAIGLRAKFVDRGCWIKPFGDVIYLTPPFVIEERGFVGFDRRDLRCVAGYVT